MDAYHRIAQFALTAFLVLSAASAFPHTAIIRSSPVADAIVQSAPREVAIFFSERIQAARSSIVVEDASGLRVDNGDSSVDANGRVMRVSLKALSAGTYNVKWRAQSTDTHSSEGRFSFRVQQ
jgi:methionine-rich copper-binding protein CopC